MTPQDASDILNTLAPRERDILKLLAEGLSNREIANRLYFTLQTVKWYNRQIYEKLGVNNRTEATKLAIEHGFFSRDAGVQAAHKTHHLPVYLTRFIGRQLEMATIKTQLRHARLVTVTGMGGAGKTRLCVEVARAIAGQFEDGVYFVPLAPISNASMVASTIAQILNIGARTDKPASVSVSDYLRDKNLLLVLDNFEHVIEQSPLLATILDKAPAVRILVSSREVLHISHELEFALNPISLPPTNSSTSTLMESDAVALFIDRMRVGGASDHLSPDDIRTIAQICAQLDGLPLAIELAAARHRLLSLEEMLHLLSNRLAVLRGGARDMCERQQTLRATIDWSYKLLSDDEKMLFTNLSVFRGGCTFEAVLAVGAAALSDDYHVVNCLTALVDKSLITYQYGDEGRFSMLPTLAEYGLERLAEENRLAAINQRHAEFFVDYSMTSASQSPSFDRWSQRLELEHDNMRAAMVWCLANDRIDLAAQMMVMTTWRWNIHPGICEWYQLGQQILARAEELAPNLRGMVMNKIGFYLALYCAGYNRFRELNDEAIRILREWGTKEELAHALIVGRTVANVEESLATFMELNNLVFAAWAYNNLGELARQVNDYALAKSHYERGLALADAVDFHTIRSLVRLNLAQTLLHLDEIDAAQHILIDTLAIIHANHDHIKRGHCMGILGCLAVKLGKNEQAATLFGMMDKFIEQMGTQLDPLDEKDFSRFRAVAEDQLPQTVFGAAWEHGHSLSFHDASSFANQFLSTST